MAVETIFTFKDQRIASAAAPASIAGAPYSGWLLEGCPSNGAVPPTNAAIPDNTTAGGLLQTDPAGGFTKYIHAALFDMCICDGELILYDRLLHVSGFNGTLTTEQFVDSGNGYIAVNRINDLDGDDGVGNAIYVEIYTIIGVTARTLTVNYKNQANTAQSTTVALGGTGRREVGRWLRVPLVAGDTGVRSIKSVQLDNSTGTAGNFGVTIAYKLIGLPCQYGQPQIHVGVANGFVRVLPDACLFFAFIPAGTPLTAQVLSYEAQITFVDKAD